MMNKIKAHFKKNKRFYYGLIVGVGITGITYLIMRRNSELLSGSDFKLLSGAKGHDSVVVDNTTRSFSLNFFAKESGNPTFSNNVYTSIHTGSRGSSGFVTKNLETGQLFQTQKAAAEAFGITESILSSHLNGKFEDALGYHFERVGVL